MEGRRVRRFGRVQQHSHTLLPLRVTHLTNTISCWYCDFKSSALNQPLFRFGRKYARHLRAWFSIGIGFSLTALLGVSMILLWESARALHIYNGNAQVISLLSGSLFGFSPSVSGLSVSFADIGYMFIASIISVCTHEVGHALAAASEGIQMEYTAVFLAVLFPGALVAFNHELLQALPRIAALRIYCAGIWHNAAFCAVCALTLFLLPLILYPIFIHNESPMKESCLAPVQMPGLTWVEITYSSPYSPKCRQIGQKSFPAEKNLDLEEMSCGGTFVFIGDLSLMARSIWLTSYRPRWSFSFGAHFPNVVEKLLICTFHVSLTLALLNSLPVYFLDGESILETILCFFSSPSLRQRERVLQSCLLGGTLVSILIFLRIFFLAIL